MRTKFEAQCQIKPNHLDIFTAIFIDLWPCLFTTKLSYAQLYKWGHSNPAKRWEFPGKFLIQVPPFNYLFEKIQKLRVYFVEKIKLFLEPVNFPILFSEGHVSFTTATLDIRIQHEFGCLLSKGLYTRNRQRFFVRVGHQTTNASIGNKHFFL